MTDEQKDALAGKLMFEYNDLVKEIGILDAQAKTLGRAFSQAGATLSTHPQNLIFEKVSHDGRFNGPLVKVEELDGQRVLQITNEIRSKIVRRDDIVGQLKGMGIDVSHR